MGTADHLSGAAFVAIFAATVLLSYHKLPNVNEALHFYRENDVRLFIAMRTCHLVISTALALNLKFILAWAFRLAWRRFVAPL